jgi:hypothetical protein
MTYSENSKHIGNSGEISSIASAHGNYDYIVYAYTSLLQMNYFSFDWIHYRIMYGSSVHIIDVKSKTMIGKANCFINADEEGGEPTFDEMFADDGKRLKDELARHATTCADLAMKRFNI